MAPDQRKSLEITDVILWGIAALVVLLTIEHGCNFMKEGIADYKSYLTLDGVDFDIRTYVNLLITNTRY